MRFRFQLGFGWRWMNFQIGDGRYRIVGEIGSRDATSLVRLPGVGVLYREGWDRWRLDPWAAVADDMSFKL